jgi:hypothetical protein
MSMHSFRIVAMNWLTIVCAHAACANPPATANLAAEYDKLRSAIAQAIPSWRPADPANGSLLFVAPDQYTSVPQAGDPNQDERNQYADALFKLAARATEAGELSLAFQWATEAVRENPDHAGGRRVLGYERRDGVWLTPFAVRMADAGKVWHAKYGWISAADVSRYDAGLRLLEGRWISADADSQRHGDMKNGWQLRTDHFLITTNHSLQAAAELAAQLERLHQVWRQLFAGFYLRENEIRALFAGERQPRQQLKPFRVYYHRTKDEYVAALRHRQPRIAETLGIYFDTHRQAHFFAGPDENAGPLYHEAVHQLTFSRIAPCRAANRRDT